jgi:hypothetical protein
MDLSQAPQGVKSCREKLDRGMCEIIAAEAVQVRMVLGRGRRQTMSMYMLWWQPWPRIL